MRGTANRCFRRGVECIQAIELRACHLVLMFDVEPTGIAINDDGELFDSRARDHLERADTERAAFEALQVCVDQFTH